MSCLLQNKIVGKNAHTDARLLVNVFYWRRMAINCQVTTDNAHRDCALTFLLCRCFTKVSLCVVFPHRSPPSNRINAPRGALSDKVCPLVAMLRLQALMQRQWPARSEPHHCLTAAPTCSFNSPVYPDNYLAVHLISTGRTSWAKEAQEAWTKVTCPVTHRPREQPPSNCLSDSKRI